MAVPLANPEDVAAIWRPVAAGEVARVTYLIALASAQLRARLPFDVDARIALVPPAPLALDPVLVAGVVARIVKRALVNPDGLQSSTRTVGPYSESRTFVSGDVDASGDVSVTDADIADLMPRRGAARVHTMQLGLTGSMLPEDIRWQVAGWTRGSYPLLPGQVP